MRFSIHREGVPIIAGFIVVAAALWFVWSPLGWVGAALSLWCVWFFRDPERDPPQISGAILSPADGRALALVEAAPPEELGMGPALCPRISIFMNVFDVHVNRIPADGVILETHYRPGRFFNASFDKASEHNERLSVRMKLESGEELAFVQIAGLIARRIRSNLSPGDSVRAGDRFGLIRFGSRLDVYLPPGVEARITEGTAMAAGETVIAVIDDQNVTAQAGGSARQG